ncbi:MAG: multidrug effflux MFS transporter [Nocardioides sp.]
MHESSRETLAPSEAPPQAPAPRSASRVILVLGAMTGLGACSLDMYLPAIPDVQEALDTSRSATQATITACMIGLAAGQLLLGALSDRLGRRPVLLGALSVFSVASLICALTGDVTSMIVVRVIQGFGAGAAAAVTRAVARDIFSGSKLLRALGWITTTMAAAPVFAPIIGAGVARVWDWRTIFVVLSAIGLILLTAVVRDLPESHPASARLTGRASIVGHDVLVDRAFWAGAGPVICTSGSLFAYLGTSSFLLQEEYGLSSLHFSIDFGINAAGLASGAWVGRLLGRWLSGTWCLRIGVFIALVGGLLVAAAAATSTLPVLLAGFFLITTGHGWAGPHGMAVALGPNKTRAGAVSAWFGFGQYGSGAVVGVLVGAVANQAVAVAAVVLACCAIGLLLASISHSDGDSSGGVEPVNAS